MPKQTFFNLPQEKRLIIEQSALDEFSEYGFDNSNMNRIVAQSKIAKGSFYQYFEDKKDLYFHLIDTLVTRKLSLIEPILSSYRNNTFAVNMKEIFRVGLAFADSDPKLFMLGEDFGNKQPSFKREFIVKYSPMATDIYRKLLEHSRETGELREDINIPMTASFINSLMNQVITDLIGMSGQKKQRDAVVAELIKFVERSILKNA